MGGIQTCLISAAFFFSASTGIILNNIQTAHAVALDNLHKRSKCACLYVALRYSIFKSVFIKTLKKKREGDNNRCHRIKKKKSAQKYRLYRYSRIRARIFITDTHSVSASLSWWN